MSSEKFEDLEDELKALHEDITGKITNKIPKLSGGMNRHEFHFKILNCRRIEFKIVELAESKLYNNFPVLELRKSTIREVEKKIEDANLIVSKICLVKYGK